MLRLFQLPAILIAMSGIFVANARYHGALAGVFLLNLAIGTFQIFVEPGGGLAPPP